MIGELDTHLGQLLWVGFPGPEPPPSLLERIRAGRVGGVILFARNIIAPSQVAELCQRLREAAPAGWPLLIGVDQEGGRVQRLRHPLAAWPPMREVAARGDPELTYRVGQAIGQDLRLLGFNVDFAPVLDVVQGEENAVIGDRSFGATPEVVTLHGLALAQGLLEAGVLPCLKHFPGHGGPVADSHLHLPVDPRSFAELLVTDLPPFAAAIDAGLPLLMSSHVLYPALDAAAPATLSHAISTAYLRGQMGFKGVLVSDDMEMGAIAGSIQPGEAALDALRAGVDLLLFCHLEERQLTALEVLESAVRLSEADAARAAEALGRVRALKGALPSSEVVAADTVEERVRAEVHAALLSDLGG